jgi:hypothetical protein
MAPGELVLVSVDDHLVEPPDLFDRHLAAQWCDRAPKMVKNRRGDEMWTFEADVMPNVGLNAVAGRPPEEYGWEPTRSAQMRAGCYDVHARVGEMNANGVLASLCLPSFPHYDGKLLLNATDKGLALAALRAYNDWHIHEWAGVYPLGRRHRMDPGRRASRAGGERRRQTGQRPGRHSSQPIERARDHGRRVQSARRRTRELSVRVCGPGPASIATTASSGRAFVAASS